MDRKKRLFNRVLLVSGTSAVMLFAGYIFFTHRAAQHYFIPEGFTGWVTVKFEKPNAPALPVVDGAVEYHIPISGVLETSSKLETGWSRDEFFREGPSGTQPMPKHVDCGGDGCRWIHDLVEEPMSYRDIILTLPDHSDTLLWDGARISTTVGSAEVRTGRKTMVHFWVSPKPEPYFYPHDSLPESRKIW